MVNMTHVPTAGTFSKDKRFYGDLFPFDYVTEGSGAFVKGNNGKTYLDWVCGLGASILGYGNVDRNAFYHYMRMMLERGNGFSFPHSLEYTAAEKLANLLNKNIPVWNKVHLQVRWFKTGSAACDGAVRMARAITGKKKILSSGYHGYHDNFVSLTKPAHGVLSGVSRYMEDIPFNDISVFNGKKDVAAVIIEHPLTDPDENYYAYVRKWCDDNGALFIMDEVVTGLRFGPGGVCGRFDIHPDMICMGKALGNGMPIAAIVAPMEYMDEWFTRNDPVFISSTNHGDVIGLAAAEYVIDRISSTPTYHDYLVKIGHSLMTGLKDIGYNVIGHPERSLVVFDNEYEHAAFIHQMANAGIIMNRPNFGTLSHLPTNVRDTLSNAEYVYGWIKTNDIKKIYADHLPYRLFTNR